MGQWVFIGYEFSLWIPTPCAQYLHHFSTLWSEWAHPSWAGVSSQGPGTWTQRVDAFVVLPKDRFDIKHHVMCRDTQLFVENRWARDTVGPYIICHVIHVDKGTWYLSYSAWHPPCCIPRKLRHSQLACGTSVSQNIQPGGGFWLMSTSADRVWEGGGPSELKMNPRIPPKMDTWTTKYDQMCGPFSLNMLEQCKCHKSKKLPQTQPQRRAKIHGPLRTQFHQTPTFPVQKTC